MKEVNNSNCICVAFARPWYPEFAIRLYSEMMICSRSNVRCLFSKAIQVRLPIQSEIRQIDAQLLIKKWPGHMNKQFADYEYKITFDGRTRNKHRVVKKCTLKPSFWSNSLREETTAWMMCRKEGFDPKLPIKTTREREASKMRGTWKSN